MKFLKLGLLTFMTLGFATACHKSSTASQAPSAAKPVAATLTLQSQIQGRWIETSETDKNNVETKPDAKGYFGGDSKEQKQIMLLNIDDKQARFISIFDSSIPAGEFDYDYKINGDSMSMTIGDSGPSLSKVKTDGKTLDLTDSDGDVNHYRKLSDDEYTKLQPVAQPASANLKN